MVHPRRLSDRARLQLTCRGLNAFCKEKLSWLSRLSLSDSQFAAAARHLSGRRFDSISAHIKAPAQMADNACFLQDVKVRKLKIVVWRSSFDTSTIINGMKLNSAVKICFSGGAVPQFDYTIWFVDRCRLTLVKPNTECCVCHNSNPSLLQICLSNV